MAGANTDLISTFDFYRLNAATFRRRREDFRSGYWDEEADAFLRVANLQGQPIDMLEVGCGDGSEAAMLAKGNNYLGIDAVMECVAIARDNNPGLDFQPSSIIGLPKFQREFDAVWGCAVLLHVPHGAVLANLSVIRSVMRPGAVAFFSVMWPHNYNGHGPAEEQVRRIDRIDDPPRLFAWYTSASFCQVLRSAGFKVLVHSEDKEGTHPSGNGKPVRWICVLAKKPATKSVTGPTAP